MVWAVQDICGVNVPHKCCILNLPNVAYLQIVFELHLFVLLFVFATGRIAKCKNWMIAFHPRFANGAGHIHVALVFASCFFFVLFSEACSTICFGISSL